MGPLQATAGSPSLGNSMSSSGKPTDEEIRQQLCQQFQEQGFRQAFEVLWLHHEKRLGRFIRGRGLNEDSAREQMQEIGLKLFRYLSGHVIEIYPKTAYKITKDQIADFYRALTRLPKMVTLDELICMELEPPSGQQGKKMERWQALQQHMDACEVSREQQTAVILHHLIGYSVLEVAQITECERETVKSRLRYASLRMGRARNREGIT